MAIETDINQLLADQMFAIYSHAETVMLEKVQKRIARGIVEEGWTERKLQDVMSLREEIKEVTESTSKIAKSKLDKGLKKAYETGQVSVSKDLGLPVSVMSQFVVPASLQRLILEANNMIAQTSVKILREADDIYRAVQAEVATGLLTGIETRRQIAQRMLNRFADAGITSFVDKSGRRWEMASYAEMATRTVTARAALQGHLDTQAEIGNDLMVVSSVGNTCPVCRPWEGKVLSISGNHASYSSLELARAQGLFHPNCKHRLTAYFEGIDELRHEKLHTNPYEPHVYEAQQEQRYNERQIRRWKRREAVAMTPQEQAFARNKISEWQQRQREHVKDFDLRRMYHRESISNRRGFRGVDDMPGWASMPRPISRPEPPKPPRAAKKEKAGPSKPRKIEYDPMSSSEVRSSIDKAVDWFSEKGNEDIRFAFRKYTGSAYEWMNAFYRKGITLDDYQRKLIGDIETGFKKAPSAIEKNTKVFRATGFSYLKNAGAKDLVSEVEQLLDNASPGDPRVKELEKKLKARLVDTVVTEESFTSTAYEYGAFGMSKPVQLSINAPKHKAKTVQLAGISEYASEAEILFAPKMDNLIEDVVIEPSHGTYGDLKLKIKVRTLGHGVVNNKDMYKNF